ncbi:MAG: hypothetical protein LC637_09255 [Xanthomonadaceae bacterium]|nr:hypothetical protein [Xanthomonadaceae bacterium]
MLSAGWAGLSPARGQSVADVLFEAVAPQGSCDAGSRFVAEVSWDAPDHEGGRLELRVDSVDGSVLARGASSGQASTGLWATRDMKFVLIDPADGSVLAETGISIAGCQDTVAEPETGPSTPPQQPTPSPRMPAEPEPVKSAGRLEIGDTPPVFALNADAVLRFSPPRLRFCGIPIEHTAIEVLWDVSALGVQRAQVFIDSMDGPMFADGAAVGDSKTGDWVTNGKRFLLYLPERNEVVAEKTFRLLPCNTAEYPFEPD